MAIQKNFVIKNGFEVSTDLIIANIDTRKVGIGSTTPRTQLDVRGGIAATDINISGVGTIVTLQSTIGTIVNARVTNLNVTGIATITSLSVTGSTFDTLVVNNFSTLNGITTLTNARVTNLNVTGISTFSSVNIGNINIAGIVTGLNVSGVSTLGTVRISSGIITATSGVVTYFGDGSYLTGTASNPNLQTVLNTGNTSTIGMSISGVSTLTTLNSTSGTITNISGTAGTITTLNSTSGTITNISGTNLNYSGIITASSFRGYSALVGTASSTTTTFVVTVASKTSNHRYFGNGSGSAYFIDGTESPFLTLLPGKTYRFTQEDASNSSHQLLFYYQADRTTQYTTNVTTNGTAGSAGAYTQVIVTDTTPVVLHYQCINHAYMGNAAHFSSNVADTPYQITARSGINVTGVVTATSFVGNGVTINSSGINVTGVVTATSFVGNGSGLTGAGSTVFIDTTTNQEFFPLFTATTSGTITASGISTSKLKYNPSTGTVTATDFDALSDENYKKNVITVNNSLNKVEKLRGVSFDWKENGRSSYGVIAQELQKVLPELVHGDNPKTVNYNGIIGVLIEAIKELKKEVEELKNTK